MKMNLNLVEHNTARGFSAGSYSEPQGWIDIENRVIPGIDDIGTPALSVGVRESGIENRHPGEELGPAGTRLLGYVSISGVAELEALRAAIDAALADHAARKHAQGGN